MRGGVYAQGIIVDLELNEFRTFSLSAKDFCDYLKIPSDYLFDIGTDQSNTCTGITLRSVKEKWLIMFEVINEDVPFDTYRRILLLILDKILKNTKVRYLIMEDPLGYITGKRQQSLAKLKDILTEFVENYEGFKCEKFDFIPPQSWRKGLMTSQNPYPKTSKEACVWEIQKLYPLTKNMISHKKITGTDYDGFESCGIIIGYLNRYGISNDSNIVKIVGPRNTSKVGLAYFIYGTKAQERLNSIVKDIIAIQPDLSQKVKIYNEEEGIYGNAKMSLVDNFTVTIVSEDLDKISIMHRFRYAWNLEDPMFMVVLVKSSLKTRTLSYLEGLTEPSEIFY